MGLTLSPPRYAQFCRDAGKDVNALKDVPTPLLCERAFHTARRRNFTVANLPTTQLSRYLRGWPSRLLACSVLSPPTESGAPEIFRGDSDAVHRLS